MKIKHNVPNQTFVEVSASTFFGTLIASIWCYLGEICIKFCAKLAFKFTKKIVN